MRRIHRYETVGSTMTAAAELAAQDCPHGTVVIADEQTAGHGRYGRSWHSERGAGLYMSEVLKVKIRPDTLPVMTLALGLATAEAITKTAGVACDLRWPNDVLINGKKCAGILAQLEAAALIAGIGVNVNHTSFPDELAGLATSLKIATGRDHSREVLLENLLSCIDNFTDTLLREGRDPILRAFTHASSYVHGRRVFVDQGTATMTGVTEGLDPQGFLVVRETSGKRTTVLAGGVRPCS